MDASRCRAQGRFPVCSRAPMNTPSAQIILSPLVAGSTAARGLVCLAAMLGAVACGDTITILECPLGTQPVGDHCEAWGSVDAGGEDGGGDGLPDFRTDDDARGSPAKSGTLGAKTMSRTSSNGGGQGMGKGSAGGLGR